MSIVMIIQRACHLILPILIILIVLRESIRKWISVRLLKLISVFDSRKISVDKQTIQRKMAISQEVAISRKMAISQKVAISRKMIIQNQKVAISRKVMWRERWSVILQILLWEYTMFKSSIYLPKLLRYLLSPVKQHRYSTISFN
ncbi:hypothetical protein AALP_AA5G130400 [Arabis alpina]|uniref:Uncharacterized protein n=1 Tax=Arabis alpina TaxID=50452 RepID=A0A087GWS5_ARAAL|nr:hypothetical protein AALP_AA5G130400 [Arabis alpina]